MNKRGLILDQIPNALSIARIILTFVVMYLIFVGADIRVVITVFAVAALTDWFDGRFARWFKWESEFGRKVDMIADRFLWVGTALAFVISLGIDRLIGGTQGVLLLMIMARELITIPFALLAFASGNALPQARYIAKLTTFIQGFALPALILGVYYPSFILITIPLAIGCLVTGLISALYYIRDIQPEEQRNVGPRRRKDKARKG